MVKRLDPIIKSGVVGILVLESIEKVDCYVEVEMVDHWIILIKREKEVML